MTRFFRFLRYLKFVFTIFIKGGFVSPLASVTILAGAHYAISSHVRIYRHVRIVLGENAFLSIGSNTIINPMSTILVRSSVMIGNRVKIAHLCTIVDHNYQLPDPLSCSSFSIDDIIVGDDSILYTSSVILKGVRLPPLSVIPCLSTVKKYNSSGFIVS